MTFLKLSDVKSTNKKFYLVQKTPKYLLSMCAKNLVCNWTFAPGWRPVLSTRTQVTWVKSNSLNCFHLYHPKYLPCFLPDILSLMKTSRMYGSQLCQCGLLSNHHHRQTSRSPLFFCCTDCTALYRFRYALSLPSTTIHWFVMAAAAADDGGDRKHASYLRGVGYWEQQVSIFAPPMTFVLLFL